MIVRGESITRTDPHRHKYSDAIAEYVDLTSDGHDWQGNVDSPTGTWCHFGHWIIRGNSQGFVWSTRFPTEEDATTEHDLLSEVWCAWEESEDPS